MNHEQAIEAISAHSAGELSGPYLTPKQVERVARMYLEAIEQKPTDPAPCALCGLLATEDWHGKQDSLSATVLLIPFRDNDPDFGEER